MEIKCALWEHIFMKFTENGLYFHIFMTINVNENELQFGHHFHKIEREKCLCKGAPLLLLLLIQIHKFPYKLPSFFVQFQENRVPKWLFSWQFHDNKMTRKWHSFWGLFHALKLIGPLVTIISCYRITLAKITYSKIIFMIISWIFLELVSWQYNAWN